MAADTEISPESEEPEPEPRAEPARRSGLGRRALLLRGGLAVEIGRAHV